MIDRSLKPIVVLFGYVSDEAMIFLGRLGEIKLEMGQYLGSLLDILKLCNGLRTVAQIRENLSGVKTEVFMELMKVLFDYGIMQDSRELYINFHEDSVNPLNFQREISPSEIANLVLGREQIPNAVSSYSLATPTSIVYGLNSARKSVRLFSSQPLSYQELSDLLQSMYTLGGIRCTPSAGGLYVLDIYVAVQVEGHCLPCGLYRYDPAARLLHKTNYTVTPDLLRYALNTNLADDLGIVIFIAADLQRMATKYANRGYRYAFLEAGHAAQNAYLFAAESGMAVLEYGGFQDKYAAKLLGLPYPKKMVLIALLVGKESYTSMPRPDFVTQAWELSQQLVGEGKPLQKVQIFKLSNGKYEVPRVCAAAKYNPPSEAARRVLSDKDVFGFGMSCVRDEALIKAMAEGYERYRSGVLRVDVVAKAVDVNHSWVDPRKITPMALNAFKRFNWKPFDPNQVWQWVQGKRLLSGELVLVPVDHVFYPLAHYQLGRNLCYGSSSSGVAAHFDYQIAIEKGLLELVERDAICLTWYTRRPVCALPPTFIPHDIKIRAEYWIKKGWNVKFLNLTLDSVPVVLAIIYSFDRYPSLVSGASANSVFSVAISKAWDEAETLLLAWKRRRIKKTLSPQNVYSPLDHGKLFFQPQNLHRIDWLLESKEGEPVMPSPIDLVQLFDPMVIDLSEENISLKVVRVISERLLPINFGFSNEHPGHPRFDLLKLKWAQETPSFPHFFA